MPAHVARVDLPYSPQQVFDLVSDIESYPKFIPHVLSAKILKRTGNTLWVDQQVKLKMLKLRFTTRAEFEPPARLTVICADSPFGTFTETWTFDAAPSGGTQLGCRTEFDLRSGMMRTILSAAFAEIQRPTMRAFQQRAARLYG